MKYALILAVFLLWTPTHAMIPLEFGFADLPLELQFIAICESGADQKARGPYGEIGVMQILPSVWLKKSKELGYNIYDFKGNLAFGFYLYKVYGLKPWNASHKCWYPQLQAVYYQISQYAERFL